MSLHRSAWGYCTRFGEEGNWGIGRRGFDAEERRGEERRGEERRGEEEPKRARFIVPLPGVEEKNPQP